MEKKRKENRLTATDLWSDLWKKEGKEAILQEAKRRSNNYIIKVVENNSTVLSAGIWNESLQEALQEKGVNTSAINLDTCYQFPIQEYVIWTELDKLPFDYRAKILITIAESTTKGAFILAPNSGEDFFKKDDKINKFSAISLKKELLTHFPYVYIVVLGPLLLAVCGEIAKKNFTLSSTFPACNESKDIERTLASLTEISDEIIIGVDPRSTDNTFDIASLYADDVFYLVNPEGPPEEYQGENKVHFSWIRNQCIDRCNGSWIFMTEAHESLMQGANVLRILDKCVPEKAQIGFVFRRGNDQQWPYPWLFRNKPEFRYNRPIHNQLQYKDGTFVVRLPQVITLHERDHSRAVERAKQREIQNRITLLDDWVTNKNEASLFYVAQEWRDLDVDKSIERFEEFIQVSNNGPQKYQARIMLAKAYMKNFQKTMDSYWYKKTKSILLGAVADDWSRCDHWIWLGDICCLKERWEEAYKYYKYATLTVRNPPFTFFWIDLAYYSYLPAQRLTSVCIELDRYEEALYWSERVLELLPPDSPEALFEEAERNHKLIDDACSKKEIKDDNMGINGLGAMDEKEDDETL